MTEQEKMEYMQRLMEKGPDGLAPLEQVLLNQMLNSKMRADKTVQQIQQAEMQRGELQTVLQVSRGQIDACATVLIQAEEMRRGKAAETKNAD